MRDPGDKTNKTVLSLFSGCGGMDLGLEGDFKVHKKCVNPNIHSPLKRDGSSFVHLPRTSFKIVFANDILREAKAAYVPFFTKRGAGHEFLDESIVNLVKKAERDEFRFPHADVVIGGFPCQDFSVAGKRLGLNSHKSHTGVIDPSAPSEENRGKLYIWMKKVIEIVKPKMFIAENVKGLISLGDAKKIMESDFRGIDKGYVVLNARLLHAANYGVPQTRERVIFFGFNKKYLSKIIIDKLESEIIDPYPPKTHYLPGEKREGLSQYVSLSDVLSDLEEPETSRDAAQRSYSKAKYYGRHVQGQIEVDLNFLGPTVRAEHHGNIEFRRLSAGHGGKYLDELNHGMKERRLTVRECARIQTFPDNYEFIRSANEMGREYTLSASNAYKIIGNAVPPLLGFNIAWRLQNIWDDIFGGKK
ncbi:MAG: DNA cytosine methyltransferase [Treponema sp.]|jgi:DNA (cytosine-5)-methyltransferase 1|nr:DNA cytosine methyltransferase [Treponema sp.]